MTRGTKSRVSPGDPLRSFDSHHGRLAVRRCPTFSRFTLPFAALPLPALCENPRSVSASFFRIFSRPSGIRLHQQLHTRVDPFGIRRLPCGICHLLFFRIIFAFFRPLCLLISFVSASYETLLITIRRLLGPRWILSGIQDLSISGHQEPRRRNPRLLRKVDRGMTPRLFRRQTTYDRANP